MKGLKHFRITIEEVVSQTFDVYAKDDDEAERISVMNYDNETFVLEPGNFVSKQMQIENVTDNYISEWFEF